MLIEKVREVYRVFIDSVVAPESLREIPNHRPAANAHRYPDSSQSRRQRRQRRLNRAASTRIHGWAVRTW